MAGAGATYRRGGHVLRRGPGTQTMWRPAGGLGRWARVRGVPRGVRGACMHPFMAPAPTYARWRSPPFPAGAPSFREASARALNSETERECVTSPQVSKSYLRVDATVPSLVLPVPVISTNSFRSLRLSDTSRRTAS